MRALFLFLALIGQVNAETKIVTIDAAKYAFNVMSVTAHVELTARERCVIESMQLGNDRQFAESKCTKDSNDE
jgi:hypothetical protein